MSLDEGARDKRITIERSTETRNALNEPVKTWAPYARPWASVYYGTGTEQRQAAQTQATQVATFEILSSTKNRSIEVTDRIIFDGEIWEIRSIPRIGLNEGIKITAVRMAS